LKALSQDGAFLFWQAEKTRLRFQLRRGEKNLAEQGFDGKLCGIY
jgi:hypothetical protein